MAETAFSLIRQKLLDIRKEHEEHLSRGGSKDFSEYKKTTGIIEGLSIADREIGEMEDRYMEE